MGDNVNRWRTVYITDANKLSLRLNHMFVKSNNYEVEISLDEIKNIIVDDDKVLITMALLSELANKGIELITVDGSRMPNGVLLPLNNNVRATKKKKEQINIIKQFGGEIWQDIIEAKISNMITNLEIVGIDPKLLNVYVKTVEVFDETNREGMATKYYFNYFFGKEFKRHEDDLLNSCMNFTYQIVRSRISQNLIAKGYDPSFAMFHCSEYNAFCLSDDIIEAYRPIIDFYIVKILSENPEYDHLINSLKIKLIDILNFKIYFNDKKVTLDNSISSYIDAIFNIEIPYIFPKLIKEDAYSSDENICNV